MKVYHGSNFKYLDYILEHGISPRKNKKSNWEKAQSHPDMVYLSTAYPFYFSYCAMEEDTKGVVFEVELEDLNEDLLYPDEDFVWYVLRKDNPKIKIEEVRDNLEIYIQNWRLSIDHLGNCCYRGTISPNLLKRYCTFDSKELGQIGVSVLDPSISVLNYRFCEAKYKRQVSWFFGDTEIFHKDDFPNDFDKMAQKRAQFWEERSKNREGISVVTL